MRRRRWIGVGAVGLAALVIAFVAVPRLLHGSGSEGRPANAMLAFSCRLPVIVDQGIPGYVDVRTGQFTGAEPATGAAPVFSQRLSYDLVARRWLPVPYFFISPDGWQFVHNTQDGSAYRMLVYDLRSGADTVIWSDPTPILIRVWNPDGIHFLSDGGSIDKSELIDPVTRRVSPAPDGYYHPLPGDPPVTIDGTAGVTQLVGYTSVGQGLFWFSNRVHPKGAPNWVFYETSPGVRFYVYRGTMDDGSRFMPASVSTDSRGFWFSGWQALPQGIDGHAGSVIPPVLWHWDGVTGLKKLAISLPSGARSLQPVGPCF